MNLSITQWVVVKDVLLVDIHVQEMEYQQGYRTRSKKNPSNKYIVERRRNNKIWHVH
jgi:hypothetical protein